ncbi:MAG: FkbM family methyltransferase [Patescibacteria group bacterium]
MEREELLKKLEKAIAFSQQSRWQRLFQKPLFTLFRSLIARFFNSTGNRLVFPFKTATFWGESMFVFLPDPLSIFQWSFLNSEPEIRLMKFLINNLPSGGIFFDVGAHLGFYSLLAGKLVGGNGRVHAFEPTPRTFLFLRKNIDNKTNFFVNQLACWEKTGEIEFTDLGSTASSMNTYLPIAVVEKLTPELVRLKHRLKVKTISLDDYRQANKLTRLDFIKIDVERAEPFVLRGAKEVLTKFHPIVSIEVIRDRYEQSDQEAMALLKELGYQLFSLDSKANPIPFEKSKTDLPYENLIAVYREQN